MSEKLSEKIVWLGHSSFRIEADKVVYIDPYEISQGPEADIILISHSHYDHCSPEDVKKIQKKDTIIITEKSSVSKLNGDVRTVRPGDVVEIFGIKIEIVPAYNLNKKFHPEENHWIGFVVELGGERIYHTGDSDLIPEMDQIKADIALLPVSGIYVMTAREAARAAEIIKPKLAIPMHYGAVAGDLNDAADFKTALEGKVDVIVLDKK